MRELKFRAWHKVAENAEPSMTYWNLEQGYGTNTNFFEAAFTKRFGVGDIMQCIGIKDKNGKYIYENDILEFSDKWEWYKTKYGIKMHFADESKRAELQKQFDTEPMERRVIEIPSDYEWLLSSEIQTYWQVVGNVHENPELVTQ